MSERALMSKPWIDVSVPLRQGMPHWPGDPAFRMHRPQDMERGDVCTVSEIALGVHTGTHMDSAGHFLRGAALMDALPLDAVIGEARVLEITHAQVVTVEELEPHNIAPDERILLKTRNSTRCWAVDEFVKEFVYIPQETAAYLVARGVRTLGVDYLSVSGFERDVVETHHALLSGNVWIIEGLNLSAVEAGRYELICLPLRIADAEGAPARAVLRPL